MKAAKWIHPTTGEVRVYLNGFKGDMNAVKAFAAADKDGDAVVTVTGGEFTSQKQIDNIKSEIRKHFGLYVKFDVYLAACPAATEKAIDKSYGSAYANAYEQHTGNAFGE
jgi:hypothetical protein